MNKEQKPSQTTKPAIAVDTVLPTVVCKLCGEKGRVKQIEHGEKHCTNCGNCW